MKRTSATTFLCTLFILAVASATPSRTDVRGVALRRSGVTTPGRYLPEVSAVSGVKVSPHKSGQQLQVAPHALQDTHHIIAEQQRAASPLAAAAAAAERNKIREPDEQQDVPVGGLVNDKETVSGLTDRDKLTAKTVEEREAVQASGKAGEEGKSKNDETKQRQVQSDKPEKGWKPFLITQLSEPMNIFIAGLLAVASTLTGVFLVETAIPKE